MPPPLEPLALALRVIAALTLRLPFRRCRTLVRSVPEAPTPETLHVLRDRTDLRLIRLLAALVLLVISVVPDIHGIWISQLGPRVHEIDGLLLHQAVLPEPVSMLENGVLQVVGHHVHEQADLHHVQDLLLEVPLQDFDEALPLVDLCMHILVLAHLRKEHHLEHDLHQPRQGHRIVPAGQPPPHLVSVLAHDALMDGQRRAHEVVDQSVVQHRRHTGGLLLVPVLLDRVLGDVILLGLRPPHRLEQFQLGLLDHRTELQAKLFPLHLGPTEVAQLAEPPLLELFATSIRSSSTFCLHRLLEVHHFLDLLMLLLLLLHGPEEVGVLCEQLGHGLHSSHRSK